MKKFGILVTLLALLTACERDTSFEGPALIDVYGEFAILENFAASADNIDFSGSAVFHFTAKFSRLSEWKIEISGDGNSAMHVIEGRSNILDASNSSWDGLSGSFPSFQAGKCTAKLIIESDSFEQTTNFTITGKSEPQGIVVADFENGIQSGWKTFIQSGANMSFVIRDTGVVPHANHYYDMGGTVDWDWLIGMIEFPASAHSANGFELSDNASQVYFNAIIRKKAGLDNGIVLFQFREDENQDGNFTEANEDMYAVELKGEALNENWTIFSIKYEDLVALVNGNPADPNGNKIHNPDMLHMISCLFLANPASGYSQADMDYIIFTEGAPLRL